MSSDFNPWLALLLGILIGWLIGWLIDSWFDRRRRARAAKGLSNGTAALPGRAGSSPVMETAEGTGIAVQDGLTASAGAVMVNGERVETLDTPAVEEEPLSPLRYEALRGDTENPWVEVEAGVESAADLPGVEREDLPALSPPEEGNVSPSEPGV